VIKLWTKYFEPDILCGLLTFIAEESGDMTNSVALDILPDILQSLQRHATSSGSSFQLYSSCRLPQLVTLLPILKDDGILEEMIAAGIMANLPVHLDVAPPTLSSACKLASRINIAEVQWSRRLESELDSLRIETFLEKRLWTISTVRIISGLLYRLPSAQDGFLRWLHTDNAADTEIEHLICALHAFFDVACSRPILDENNFPALEPHFLKLVAAVSDGQTSNSLKRLSTSCIALIVRLYPSKRSLLLSSVEEMLRSLHGYEAHSHLLALGSSLQTIACNESNGIVDLLVDYGLRWLIACCAGDNELTDDEKVFLAEFGKLSDSM
jgi:nucleolar pre-ribosomal-associated protein 1